MHCHATVFPASLETHRATLPVLVLVEQPVGYAPLYGSSVGSTRLYVCKCPEGHTESLAVIQGSLTKPAAQQTTSIPDHGAPYPSRGKSYGENKQLELLVPVHFKSLL
jgi:hypothetical protein